MPIDGILSGMSISDLYQPIKDSMQNADYTGREALKKLYYGRTIPILLATAVIVSYSCSQTQGPYKGCVEAVNAINRNANMGGRDMTKEFPNTDFSCERACEIEKERGGKCK